MVTKSIPRWNPFTTEQLCDIWEKIKADPDARRALDRLDKAGFHISHLMPRDATFKEPTWADYFAALPLLPDKPTTRRIHRKSSLKKYLPLVAHLREFAGNWKAPFVGVRIFSEKDYPLSSLSTLREDLLKAASMVEHFLSWDYSVRLLNPRKALIADLRWTIRARTGRPRDRELSILIDAAFRAAGHKEGCYIDATTLDRIEQRVKEGRVKAHQRTRSLNRDSIPRRRFSTRNRPHSKKRV
jgi:hypothetical protein